MILDEIDPSLLDLAKQADAECKPIYDEIDNICFYHSNRILSAFIENNVSYSDFAEQNGYGDYDEGRNKLEKNLRCSTWMRRLSCPSTDHVRYKCIVFNVLISFKARRYNDFFNRNTI